MGIHFKNLTKQIEHPPKRPSHSSLHCEQYHPFIVHPRKAYIFYDYYYPPTCLLYGPGTRTKGPMTMSICTSYSKASLWKGIFAHGPFVPHCHVTRGEGTCENAIRLKIPLCVCVSDQGSLSGIMGDRPGENGSRVGVAELETSSKSFDYKKGQIKNNSDLI